MKKVLALFITGTMIMTLSSCGDDSVLSSSSAKKALKKEAVFSDDFATVKFNTGYYEVTESQLADLQRLKAAGMITLTSETIIEKVRKSNYDYWRGYTYYTVDKDHYFASVQLTEEGKKLEIAEPTTQRADVIKDFMANKDYEEEIPDYMINFSSAPDVTETVVEEVAEADSTVIEEVAVVEEVAVEEVTVEEPKNESKKDPNAAYNAALAKVNTEEHNMLLGRYKLEKVKEVLCSEDMAKNGTGKCVALITFVDKTPFGYVYNAPKQNYLTTLNVSFIHYQDLGWTVSSFDN